MTQHLVIIGNGIAGITTARHVRKRSDMKITVISAETDYFFSRTALMYIYMGHMKYEHTKPYEDWFWAKNKIELLKAYVTGINTDDKTLQLDSSETMSYDKLVIATGSKSNKFGWPGQDLPGVQGLYSYQDLQLMEENTRDISHGVIVGGGLIGIEVAEMLMSRQIPVTFLVREEFYWDNILPKDEAKMISRHILEHGGTLKLQTNLKEILAGDDGRVRAVTTESGQEISCQFVALTPGVSPNINVVKDSKVEHNRGILVNDFLETNVPDIYATGDCAEIKVEDGGRNRLEQLWYTGKMQGMALAKTICGEPAKYERGIWYNSAKFMDIEYQTYGFVLNQPQNGEDTFYWEHPQHHHCVRLVFKAGTEEVTGMNFFGIRMRQEVCQQWIAEGRTADFVIQNLRQANFDPEFFKAFEPEILAGYNAQRGKNLQANYKVSFFSKVFV